MRTFGHWFNWVKNSKGVATSLIEATATVAVGAVLAGVAVGGGINAINDSKVQAAIADVSAIGQGIITFYKDNSFFPLFVDGLKTGAGDTYYGFLVSQDGTFPTDSTTGFSNSGFTWQVPGTPTTWSNGLDFGHKPDYTTGQTGHASIEGHLIANILGDPTTPGTPARYPLRGFYSGDPERGWSGPYVASLPKTDPWGNKYMVNIQYLNAGFLKTYTGPNTNAPNLPSIAVIVLSSGPNRNIETPVDQPFSSFQALGDDIVFRIK
jgi:hypothetical protein